MPKGYDFICAFSFPHASDVTLFVHFLSFAIFTTSPQVRIGWITTQGRLGNFHAVRPLDKTHTYTHAVTQTSAGVSLPSNLDFLACSSSGTCPGAWGRYRKVPPGLGLVCFPSSPSCPATPPPPAEETHWWWRLPGPRERGSRLTYPIKVCAHQGSTCGKPCCYHYIKASNQRSKHALYLLRKIRRLGNYIFLLLCIINNRK